MPAPVSRDLAGSVVVITGATAGIGREAARQLVALGAKVALGGRRQERLDELVAKVKAEEHAADTITYDIMQRIDRSFVTPLDREDIHLLANRLDNVVDLMDGTARRATMVGAGSARESPLARWWDRHLRLRRPR